MRSDDRRRVETKIKQLLESRPMSDKSNTGRPIFEKVDGQMSLKHIDQAMVRNDSMSIAHLGPTMRKNEKPLTSPAAAASSSAQPKTSPSGQGQAVDSGGTPSSSTASKK
jgi:hypothetical protein